MFSLQRSIIDTLGVSVASSLGVFTRVSITDAFGRNGAGVLSESGALFSDLVSNMAGCFVLGAHSLVQTKLGVSSVANVVVATGFAGSLTTFASWNYQVTRILVRGDWVDGILALLIGIATAFLAFGVGRDIAYGFIACFESRLGIASCGGEDEIEEEDQGVLSSGDGELMTQPVHPAQGDTKLRITIALALVLVSLLFALCVSQGFFDKGNEFWSLLWRSVLLAPLGALLRWQLSRLNCIQPTFPLGTFTANMLATLLDSVIGAVLLAHAVTDGQRRWLLSVITGLGGSLSTVSTWILEASKLAVRSKYVYVISSILVAQILGVIVYGSAYWAGNS